MADVSSSNLPYSAVLYMLPNMSRMWPVSAIRSMGNPSIWADGDVSGISGVLGLKHGARNMLTEAETWSLICKGAGSNNRVQYVKAVVVHSYLPLANSRQYYHPPQLARSWQISRILEELWPGLDRIVA